MAQLQVGDKVVITTRYGSYIHKIIRVTEKSAFSENARFVREYEKYIKEVGGHSFCEFGTPELVTKIETENLRQTLAQKVRQVNPYNLTLDQLNAILNIIKPQPNGTIQSRG